MNALNLSTTFANETFSDCAENEAWNHHYEHIKFMIMVSMFNDYSIATMQLKCLQL